MMRAWRTDSVEGAVADGAAMLRPGCEGGTVGSSASTSLWTGFRGLGTAVVRAGAAAWSRSFGRRPAGFEEALHGFAADLSASGGPEAIEEALLRLARRIAPEGRVERLRATDERPGGGGDDETTRGGSEFDEFRVRCGAADHGVLRLHHLAPGNRRADGLETARRLAMACTLAACALESARLQAGWGWAGVEEEHGGPSTGLDAEAAAGLRAPHHPRGVVRDATFLNAVLPFALDQSRRHGEPVSLVCVQLDRRGAIRDLLGAPVADRLVQELGELVGSVVRTSDLVARLDDDRIVALLVRARGDDAMKVARSIGRTVAESGLGSPRLPGTSVSIGVAEFPAAARDAASLLDAADEAMMMARAAGSHSPVLAGTHGASGHGRTHAHPRTADRAPAMAACGR